MWYHMQKHKMFYALICVLAFYSSCYPSRLFALFSPGSNNLFTILCSCMRYSWCCFLFVFSLFFFLFLFHFIFIFVAVDAFIVVAGWCKMYLNFKYGIVCECWTQEIWIQRHQPKQKTENWKHQQQQQKNVTKMPLAIIWKLHTHSKVHYECAKRKRNAAGLPGWALNTQRTHTYCSNPIRIEYTQRRR